VISADLLPTAFREGYGAPIGAGLGGGVGGGVFRYKADVGEVRLPGQVGGVVLDPSGATVPGAQVTITNTERGVTLNAVTDAEGRWLVSNFPGGQGRIQIDANGFNKLVQQVNYDGNRPADYLSSLTPGAVSETIEVSAEAVSMNGRSYSTMDQLNKKQITNAASTNVLNLQRRVAGVLPVAIDVPRAGTSFQFARALILDEETKVTFSYKSR